MRSALAAFIIALVSAALLTPQIRRLALHLGAVDRPGGRRVNAEAIPRLGGIGVVLAFFAPLGVLFALKTDVARLFFAEPLRIVGLAGGGLLIAALGAADDLRPLGAKRKLLVQTVAALIAYACGFRIDGVAIPYLGAFQLGLVGLPFTVLWIVGVVNALNLIDGLDGLAGGIAFFACVTNFVIAYVNDAPLVMLLSAALAGSLFGFLLYNFNPATIFLGDSGSMFLGFSLATMSMLGAAAKSSTTIAILVPIIALGVPIMDTLFAMVRRILERRPIFSPDRGHIHHRLLDLGITHRRAVLILYGFSVAFTLAAIFISMDQSFAVGAALLVLSIVLVGIVRFVGYFEAVRQRRRQDATLHARATERLRRALPPLLVGLSGASSRAAVRSELESFAVAAELLEVALVTPATGDTAPAVRCAAPGGTTGRDRVDADFPLSSLGDGAALQLSWRSEDGEVSPQARILLQLAADACESRLAALAAASAETSARKAS